MRNELTDYNNLNNHNFEIEHISPVNNYYDNQDTMVVKTEIFKPQPDNTEGKPDIDHRSNYMPIGVKKPSFAYDRQKSPRLDFSKIGEERDQDEKYLKDREYLRQQVHNYDRIVHVNPEDDKSKIRNLNKTKPITPKKNMAYKKYIKETTDEEPMVNESNASTPYEGEKYKEKQPMDGTDLPSFKRENEMPLKASNKNFNSKKKKKPTVDNSQHPGAKKYHNMMEKMTQKVGRNTTYRNSYIPPEFAEVEQKQKRTERAKT